MTTLSADAGTPRRHTGHAPVDVITLHPGQKHTTVLHAAALAFASMMAWVIVELPPVMLSQFVAKVGVEVVFTPVTYKIVAAPKRAEHEDYYDRHTDFNPFTPKT